ncbi:MAG: hypothetical protein U0835_07585 [Isosphaeraceae bacterium]
MSDLTRLGVRRSVEGPRASITLCELLLARLPLPKKLGGVEGLSHSRIPEYARLAMQDHCHRTNPRACDPAGLETLLDRAW